MIDPVLRVDGLAKHFPVGRGWFGPRRTVRAVDGVSFDVGRGEILGLVGESGSGKTTVGRAILRLTEPTAGKVLFDGTDVTTATPDAMRALRRRMQIIFQDPYASLDPRRTVRDQIVTAFHIHDLHPRAERRDRAAEILRRVGILPEQMDRYPHEFSGGQRQRISIARALALGPSFIVADEAVSALDVSIQAQIVNLLLDLRDELDLTILFISHDLGLVEYICDRVVVMYLGRVVEIGTARELYRAPRHPYTRALLSAIPIPDPTARRASAVLGGDVPSPISPPAGCGFRTRCPHAVEACALEAPALRPFGESQSAACIRDDVVFASGLPSA
ncbi:ABC transporter ATP-binding protein [Chelatococcus sp. GCM10030263]|uniref:ABC transporter ATP-binding protein n=1 Tax=Chelatococcus sp. GCM10030263 TaxID=3273387 RepID=UPI003622D736